jgi:hypothetical protein
MKKIIKEQQEICQKYSTDFMSIDLDSMVGISDNTNGVYSPINGMRHPQNGNSSGWYIWSGEYLSQEKDFFKPLHAKHLAERCPQVLKYLALPPGYRFLIDTEGYVDVWYDPMLLDS